MGMYVASRTAGCPYCTRTLLFLRAAARPRPSRRSRRRSWAAPAPFTPGELATVAVARSLAQVPCTLTAAERDELTRCFGPANAEWIVAGVAMMGFLNKFMDAVGVELEPGVVAETAETPGADWSAGQGGQGAGPRVPRTPPAGGQPVDEAAHRAYLPAALRLDRRWLRGVPHEWPALATFLRERTGHDFPVLAQLRHARVARSVAAMLRENLDPDDHGRRARRQGPRGRGVHRSRGGPRPRR
jgi:hypothetical protein